jgi:cellulose synthase/poly-beta-1,6-N-acetylglucosamine synthase-like glycosyltransferase
VRVTVVIPAHNEAASIGGTLTSLQQQSLRPRDILVVCDNCTDDTAEVAARHGARIFVTKDNTARKAGALNQALNRLLPKLRGSDLILVMDADSQLSLGWLENAVLALAADSVIGAVCGVYVGEDGGGFIGQMQRNEYYRYGRLVFRRRQANVLSGTGTLFRVMVLRRIARQRSGLLPGIAGDYYNSASLAEDYEITLALKTLGFGCQPGAGCQTVTEVMPTWRTLFRQRLRWQAGTLQELRRYGFGRVTASDWLRQLAIYAGFVATITCWTLMIWGFAHSGTLSLAWTLGVLWVFMIERIWTVRRGGAVSMLLTAVVLPELGYDVFRMSVFFRALVTELTRREVVWSHL